VIKMLSGSSSQVEASSVHATTPAEIATATVVFAHARARGWTCRRRRLRRGSGAGRSMHG
ncbi:MAG: hypothetical protein ACPHRO_04845, partial [Nannocystaceae bacterium]